jgi:hypothetical protein
VAYASEQHTVASAALNKGEMLNQEHTPAKGVNPVFGGYEVGIGFSGTCTADSGEIEGIALAGKRSLRLAASLRLMRRV